MATQDELVGFRLLVGDNAAASLTDSCELVLGLNALSALVVMIAKQQTTTTALVPGG